MQNELLEDLEKVFQSASALRSRALNLDASLLEYMLEKSRFKKEFKSRFFAELKNALVFKQQDFLSFLELKARSFGYTSFKTKIGLGDKENKLLGQNTQVVLNFAYKDCVLKGDKSKDDKDKSKELFFNEILAHDEIDMLEAPKTLCDFELIKVETPPPL